MVAKPITVSRLRASVLRVPSQVKASLTGTKAGRSLLATQSAAARLPVEGIDAGRTAVIVRPQNPFLNWVRAVDEDAPEATLDRMDTTLDLVPGSADPADARRSCNRLR